MKIRRLLIHWCVMASGAALLLSCAFDTTLREFLSARFWLPFAKHAPSFERPNVRRIFAPFAGMDSYEGKSSLAILRRAYQRIPAEDTPLTPPPDFEAAATALAAAHADASLSRKDREEVDLIDAKLDMRMGERDNDTALESARTKLTSFLKAARDPAFRSEARGWLAHVDYLLGDQTQAGKIYLDELNHNGSNLSRETLLNSLQMTYGYDGGPKLADHIAEYFDTPEHAAFAIQLVTNPRWDSRDHPNELEGHTPFERRGTPAVFARIKRLLEEHKKLLESNAGANALALLTMRTALRMGDLKMAREIAAEVPPSADIRGQPDFNWMSASAAYLSRDYAGAEKPLLALFESSKASNSQKCAAAYGLCGVYFKTGNFVQRIRFALWLHTANRKQPYYSGFSGLSDLSIYWAPSGWDLGLLLDAEAPLEALRAFIEQNPEVGDVRLVKYSLAVRLARENRYDDAAEIYRSIDARRRAPRMRELAELYRRANREGASGEEAAASKIELAKFLVDHSDGIYFNDAMWHGFQNYAMQSRTDSRLTRAERDSLMMAERKLRDDQEERWRAYLILRGVVDSPVARDTQRKAALLALSSLGGINERFGRQDEIAKSRQELVRRLER